MNRDAGREQAAGRNDALKPEPMAGHAERGHRIAACVNSDQHPTPRVISKGSLRAEMVRLGSRCRDTAATARRGGGDTRQVPVAGPLKDQDAIAARFVGLDEDDTAVGARTVLVTRRPALLTCGVVAVTRRGHRRGAERGNDHPDQDCD